MIELAVAAGVAPWIIEKIIKKIKERKKLTKKEEKILDDIDIPPPPNPFQKDTPKTPKIPQPFIPPNFDFYDADMDNSIFNPSSKPKPSPMFTPSSSNEYKERKGGQITPWSMGFPWIRPAPNPFATNKPFILDKILKMKREKGGKCLVKSKKGGKIPGLSMNDLKRMYLN